MLFMFKLIYFQLTLQSYNLKHVFEFGGK